MPTDLNVKIMISIIIPAYNEESVLSRCLDSVLRDAKTNEFEIIVVCNGCIDNTKKIAESYGDKVVVFNTEQASKTLALNIGDENAHHFPRFYLDADIIITTDSIRKVAISLEDGASLAAAPKINFDTSKASFMVKQFYKVWQFNPYFTNMIGSGLYALSKKGRSKFGAFPAIISDDEYMRIHFKDKERKTVDSCSFTVVSPKNLNILIKIKTRARLGCYQLQAKYPTLTKQAKKKYSNFIWNLLKDHKLWFAVGVYVYVTLMTKVLAKKRLSNMNNFVWDKDNSSRTV